MILEGLYNLRTEWCLECPLTISAVNTVMNTSHLLLLCIFISLSQLSSLAARMLNDQTGFDQNYAISWGRDHVRVLDRGSRVQLSMDKSSGSGFSSKLAYDSGFFGLSIKTPGKDTAGVVTAFYLASNARSHDELDFEFMGNKEGEPVTLQTNIFTNGYGNREQRLHLWFDPSNGFHDYKILWNPYHIVFFVDDTPVRIFRNQTNKGFKYVSQPMNVIASLWNGEDWATNGGKDKIKWGKDPFIAEFQSFNVDGCSSNGSNKLQQCSSSNFWWNVGMYKELTPAQEIAYQKVQKSLSYDYCTDKKR
ncbi:uncharacterized protein A4U43_C08F3430 [Asparagus officinalis]|nr:uncharacterized protein A4U43_C08F3430 [Asparagus officinalis]